MPVYYAVVFLLWNCEKERQKNPFNSPFRITLGFTSVGGSLRIVLNITGAQFIASAFVDTLAVRRGSD